MTTLERLATINVTINFALPLECLTIDDLISMGNDAINAIEKRITKKMDAHTATEDEESLYWEITEYYDRQYYYDNIDAFREYQSHMGEPDFDWGFYSDWHKDMYGFRPH